MRQLAGTDAYHVLEERPGQHMHTMKIVVVDAASASTPITVESTRRWAAEAATLVPALRWRLVGAPLRLGRPFWLDAAALDVDHHVVGCTIAPPGGPEQLDGAIADIASTPLARDRPLWQLWVLDGLADGEVALAFKMHHAIADGGASVRILEELFGAIEPPGRGVAESAPSRLTLAMTALAAQVRQWAGFPRIMGRQITSLREAHAMRKSDAPPVTPPLAGPMTRFNRPITPNRVYVDVTVPLQSLRHAKDALDATLNDVYLTLCGGAIRRYLAEHDELPSASLTATSPVSLRTDEESGAYGNRISYWYVTLGTDQADPVARLAAVSQSTQAARQWAASDKSLFSDWQDHYMLFRLLTRRLLAVTEKLVRRPAFNAIVSNVRGPGRLTFQGAPIVAVRSMGPLVAKQCLNFTAWSYGDDLSIGIHACREHAPDLQTMGRHVREELAALEQATENAARPAQLPV
jgi:WS/DGAT/MGAT family acyltransferase